MISQGQNDRKQSIYCSTARFPRHHAVQQNILPLAIWAQSAARMDLLIPRILYFWHQVLAIHQSQTFPLGRYRFQSRPIPRSDIKRARGPGFSQARGTQQPLKLHPLLIQDATSFIQNISQPELPLAALTDPAATHAHHYLVHLRICTPLSVETLP